MSTPTTSCEHSRAPRRWLRWLLGILVAIAAIALMLRLWQRAQLQTLMDEVWRRADEGKVIVAAIEKYRADKGEYPKYVTAGKNNAGPLESLYPDYVREPVPYCWYFDDEDSPANLYIHFAFVEWNLYYDFETRRWTFNGEPLEQVPRRLPFFSW